MPTYHENAQKFIKNAREMQAPVYVENGNLVAYPKKKRFSAEKFENMKNEVFTIKPNPNSPDNYMKSMSAAYAKKYGSAK